MIVRLKLLHSTWAVLMGGTAFAVSNVASNQGVFYEKDVCPIRKANWFHCHGATDELGHYSVEDVVNHYDYHATLLHLFGIDHEQLTYQRNSREQSLLDGQPGKIVSGLLAEIGECCSRKKCSNPEFFGRFDE